MNDSTTCSMLSLVRKACPVMTAGLLSLLGFSLTVSSAIAQGPPAPPVQPPAQFETGAVVVSQANADAWQWVPFTRTFAKPPVVIMGPAMKADAAPLVVTAVDVYTTGFYCQLNEYDYLDGAHANETVHFLALSEGNHNFGGQIWQVGRVQAVNRTPATITLTGFGAATPVVLAQVDSYNNWIVANNDGVQAIKTRVSNVLPGSFQVQLESEEATAASILNNENIRYIAVSQGTGYLDGKILSAVRAPTAATTHTLASVTFPASRTNPIFIGQSQTINDTNPGELRMTTLTSASVQVQFLEEISANADVTHTAEVLGYIVLGDMSGETLAKVEVGDLNVTQSSATTWTKVNLASTYTTPVVVMGPLSYTGGTSLTIRVRNALGNDPLNAGKGSFEFQVDRWGHHTTQTHTTLEHISYMAMETGTYAVGGVIWQAGRKTGVTQTAGPQALSASFTAAPAVFSQVVSPLSGGDTQAVQSRVTNVLSTGFSVELDESEIDTTAHAAETVHWIAMTQGSSNFFSTAMRFQAGSVTGSASLATGGIDSAFRTRSFSRMHADPFLFAAMQTAVDPDPATLRWRYLFADRVDLVAQEDAHPYTSPPDTGGTVNNTHSSETVAFLTIQGAVDTDSDGAPDAWESSVGLNANNSSDGSADGDGDVLTNQQEYHNRLDFATSSSHTAFTGGIVTVGNAVTNGYEINDKTAAVLASTNARFRIYRNGGLAPLTLTFTAAGTAPTDTTRAPASAADYTLWTGETTGTQLTTSIPLTLNAQSVDVYVRPTVVPGSSTGDNLNEYVEGLRLTATSSASYTLGTTTNSVVLIHDFMELPANEKLFVGPLLPQSGATTSASGFATIILNGPNTKARISATFNGLTTPQLLIDGNHVHYANTGTGPIADKTIIYGEPDGLPPGQLYDFPWTITDLAGLKGQQIIDALFRKNTGENLYINVHTNRYASGEIRADLTYQTGSQTPPPIPATPTLENFPANAAGDEMVKRDCARFLTQATFGATEADITALYNTIATPKTTAANRIAAFTNWLNAPTTGQWSRDQTTIYDYTRAADAQEWERWGLQPNLPAVVDNPATTTVDETYPAAPPPSSALDWTRWGSVPSPITAWPYRPVPVSTTVPLFNFSKESYDTDNNNRRRAWWMVAMRGHDQLRQRTAAALEQIFVVSDREGTISTRHYGHARYLDMLADFADGVRHVQPPNGTYTPAVGGVIRVRELLEDISKSPIMGKYLSHLKNQKAIFTDTNSNGIQDPGEETTLSPDENYAREIMQLFSIGLLELHYDGSLKLGPNGQPIATYTNDDIKELSRVFTGWSFAWSQNTAALGYVPAIAHTTNFFGSEGAEYFHPGYENPMKNFVAYHDEGAKTFLPAVLPVTLPAYSDATPTTAEREAYAEAEMDSTMDKLFNHPNIGPFLCKLLIQRFVTSNPSRGYLYRVGLKFDNDGSGVRGNLKAVVNAILLDYEARSLTNVDPQIIGAGPATSVNVGFGKVKEPILRYAQVLRAFNARSQLNVGDLTTYLYPGTQLDNLGTNPTRFRYGDTIPDLAQRPHNMPSVFNWYLPDYTPGGRVASAGLVAPELQIMTENIVVRSINYHRTVDYSSVIDSASPTLPAGQGVSAVLGDTNAALDNVFIDLGSLTTAYIAQRDLLGAAAGAEVTAATWLVDRLDALLCSGSLKAKYAYVLNSTDPRSIMIDQLATIAPDPAPVSNANGGARVRAALYLITSSPEFIVQK